MKNLKQPPKSAIHTIITLKEPRTKERHEAEEEFFQQRRGGEGERKMQSMATFIEVPPNVKSKKTVAVILPKEQRKRPEINMMRAPTEHGRVPKGYQIMADFQAFIGNQRGDMMPYPIQQPALVSSQRLCLRHLGARYYEGEDGYYVVTQKTEATRVTNFLICVRAELLRFGISTDLQNAKIAYKVEVTDVDGVRMSFEVEASEWANLGTLIEKRNALCMVMTDEQGNARECFRRIANLILQKTKCQRRIVLQRWGWGPLAASGERRFFHGGLEGECTSTKCLSPQTSPEERRGYIEQAVQIFNVGESRVTIPLVLYAASAYVAALFEDAGFRLDFSMMLIGQSGFLKTAFSRVVFNVFEDERHRVHSIRGTAAAMRVLHQQAYDDVLVVDDFNLEGSQKEVQEKRRNFQSLVRAYSDGTPREKYGGNHDVCAYAIRGGCVITGETQVSGQIRSGELRYLKVVLKERFDGERLKAFQDNPRLMQELWSGFIRFLEARYSALVEMIRSEFPMRRAEVAGVKEPRLCDDVAHLTLVAEIFGRFLQEDAGLSEDYFCTWREQSSRDILELVREQEENAESSDPALLYLEEIFNLLGMGRIHLAPSLDAYCENIAAFVGYVDASKDWIWLKSDEIFVWVRNVVQARGDDLPLNVNEANKQLKRRGWTVCDTGSCLKKASSKIKGRPRMVVLKRDVCEKEIGGK